MQLLQLLLVGDAIPVSSLVSTTMAVQPRANRARVRPFLRMLFNMGGSPSRVSGNSDMGSFATGSIDLGAGQAVNQRHAQVGQQHREGEGVRVAAKASDEIDQHPMRAP